MGESLIISKTMDLNELADRMGGATINESYYMRSILCRSAYHGLTTADVLDRDWHYMCDQAVKKAEESAS